MKTKHAGGRPKKYIVYQIQNKISGKRYIGQTGVGLNMRMKSHLSSKLKTGIDGAIKKHGIQMFDVTTICYAETLSELNGLEVKYISGLNTLSPNGYNLHSGGNNHECSDETRERLRFAATGRKVSAETREKMCLAGKQKVFSVETRQRISDALRGRKHTKEHVAKLKQNQKGFMEGDKHPRAILSNDEVLQAKQMIKDGFSNMKISSLTGINNRHVALIKLGRAYRNVGS